MFVVWVDRQTDGQQMVSLPQCWEARIQRRQGRRAQSDGVPVSGVREVALEKAGPCESTYRGCCAPGGSRAAAHAGPLFPPSSGTSSSPCSWQLRFVPAPPAGDLLFPQAAYRGAGAWP